jgi:hypothetical protein
MLEKVLPARYRWPRFASSDQRNIGGAKRPFRPPRNSKLILLIFFFITLVSGIGSSTIPARQVYGQMPPSSSSSDNVCTAEEQSANVCIPEDPSSSSDNVCTAKEQSANVCIPDESDLSCEGNLDEEIKGARKTLGEAFKNSENFIKLQMANGQIKKFPTSNLYWFAKLYEYTTFLEIEKIKTVEHPAMVAHFIPVFFGLYKKDVDSYLNRDTSKVSTPWMQHFKSSGNEKITLSGAENSITTAVVAHIQGDMPQAFVLAYKSFTNKYCPASPPPLEYFRSSFFSPAALKIFPESQATMFTEISRVMNTKAPFSPSIETGQLGLGIGAKYFGLGMDTVFKWREDAWNKAKMELDK